MCVCERETEGLCSIYVYTHTQAPGLGIYGAAAGATGCLQKIKDLVALKASPSLPKFIGYPDSVSAYLDFPDWTRFLGASEFYDLTGSPAAERAMLSWSYDSVVPAYRVTRYYL